MPVRDEKRIERAEDPADVVRLPRGERMRDGRANVRVVGGEPCRRGALADAVRSLGARLREGDHVGASCRRSASVSPGSSNSAGERTDRLEHPVALAREAKEALLDERLQRVEVGAGRPLPRRRACSRPRRRRGGRRAVSPRRRAGRTTTRSSPAASAGAGSASRPPLRRSSRCESRSRICAGERALVRAAASSTASGSESRRAHSSAISSDGSSCARSQKSATASGSASGGTANSTSPCTRRSSRLVHEQGEVGAAGEERRELRRRRDHLLEVVEEQEQLALADVLGETVPRAERLGDRLRDERGIAKGGEPDPEDPCFVVGDERGGGLDARDGSCRSRPGPVSVTRRAPPAMRASTSSSSRSRPTKELAGRGRLVFEIVLSGGKEPSPSWKRETAPSRPSAGARRDRRELPRLDQRRGRSGDENLAAVTCGRNPSGEVDVVAHVALVRHERRPRVQPDADVDRARRELLRDRRCGGERARRRREGDEERIALRVDFDPVVRAGRLRARRAGARRARPRSAPRRARAGASSSPRRR